MAGGGHLGGRLVGDTASPPKVSSPRGRRRSGAAAGDGPSAARRCAPRPPGSRRATSTTTAPQASAPGVSSPRAAGEAPLLAGRAGRRGQRPGPSCRRAHLGPGRSCHRHHHSLLRRRCRLPRGGGGGTAMLRHRSAIPRPIRKSFRFLLCAVRPPVEGACWAGASIAPAVMPAASGPAAGGRCRYRCPMFARRSRLALVTTDSDERAMAAAAIIGESTTPKRG